MREIIVGRSSLLLLQLRMRQRLPR